MATRSMNYTQRVDLKKKHVKISLSPKNSDGIRHFDLALDLPEQLPSDAMVSVEAYRSSMARMRFDFGTVGELKLLPQADRLLHDFTDDLPPPLFRVKVTGAGSLRGRLLADARSVRVVGADELVRREGMLHIAHKDLDGPAWEVDFTNAGYEPTLWIDDSADIDRQLASSPLFIALVYPEVIRRVLDYLLFEDKGASFDDESAWGHPWLKVASAFPQMQGIPCPHDHDDDQEKRNWIDQAMRSFAKSKNIQGLLEEQQRGQSDAV